MRLSEAIREGCQYSAKVRGTRLHENGSRCALGAAEDAAQRRGLSCAYAERSSRPLTRCVHESNKG